MAKKISQIEVGGETYDINGGGGGSAGDALKQVSNMATYTPTDGEIVQYIGATTADYVHAGIYEYGVNMKTFAVGANKSGIPQGIYRTKASPTTTNLFVSSFNGSDGNTYHSAYYPKLRVGDVMWNISTAESFYITAVNSETSYELENGVTATFSGSTHGGSIQVYEIDGYYFFDYSNASIFTRAGYDVRSGFLMVGDVGEEFNNFTSTVFSGWFQLNQIGEGDVTVKKHGATVQTFNVNQQGNTNVELPNDVEMVHFNSGKAFYEAVTVCTEQNGLIYDPQELIDNPSDPSPLLPESDVYYYATNTDKVYAGETGDSDFVDVTESVKLQNDTHKIYVDVDNNLPYRYNGSDFVAIGAVQSTPKDGDVQWGASDGVYLRTLNNGKGLSASDLILNDISGNGFAFLPAAKIVVEYTRDGGSTWTDYGLTDAQKVSLLTLDNQGVGVGKNDSTYKATTAENYANYQCRITINTDGVLYSQLVKFIVNITTNGSNQCICDLYAATHGDTSTFSLIQSWSYLYGWSGYNVLNLQNILTTYGNRNEQYQYLRFVFRCTAAGNTDYTGLKVIGIKAFGQTKWTNNSVMAKTGHLYSYNELQTMILPTALKLSGGRAQGSGDDEGIVVGFASNNLAGLCLGNPNGERSVIYCNNSSHKAMWRYNNGTTSYDLNHPQTSGTIPVVWTGTLSQYNAITTKNAYTIYLISD